ncbi:MAG: TonB-dependent receptor [Bacteroidales bacterium]|nr:TonB-dependent receptor [Bacteroidales bacterium]
MKKVILILTGLLLASTLAFAQNGSPITVTGKVVDESDNPLIGATVAVRGTSNGTITDLEGAFSISAESDAVLVFTYVSFVTKYENVDGRTNVGTIMMEEDSKSLDQVVVIGYGTQKKVDLTGSVAIVDAEEMKKVSKSNISSMLEGKVAGVQITSDGQPGADPNVRIRGIGSFGSTAPLYVIDGVPMGTSIRDFSPNDIATIQIPKDASAAAIYGSRAANGVVIITTKQGKQNQPMRLDYSGYFGFDKVNKNVYDVMDTEEFVAYIQKAAENSGTPLTNMSGYDPNSENYFLKPENCVNTDWFDAVFKTGVRQNHNVNLSGGSKTSTYNIGLDFFDQKGCVEGTGPDYKRYTVRVNNTMDVKFVKLKTGLVYSHSDQNSMFMSNSNEFIQGLSGDQGNLMSSILTMQPTILAVDESTWVLDDIYSGAEGFPYDAYGYGVYNSDIHGDIAQSNPLVLNNIIERATQVDRLVATASANVDLFGMFNQKSENHKLSYNINLSYSKTYAKDFVWIPTWFQSDKIKHTSSDARLDQGYRQYTDALIENTINYEGKLGNKNHLSLVVGQTFESEFFHTLTAWGYDFTTPIYLQINNAAKRDAATEEAEHNLASYIGRLSYDYDNRYLLQATVRRDGSSRLSSNDRWAWFPSVSLGWRLDREAFFPVSDQIVNLLKFRGSYGILGNENIGNYRYISTMNRKNFAYSFGGGIQYGSAVSEFVNQMIAWEKKKSTSVGFDLGMFGNQFEFTFEWYKNVSEKLLYDVPVPVSAGVSNKTVTMNAAEMENTGFEWSAAYHNSKHDIKYDIAVNASTLKNKVVTLGFGQGDYLTGDYMTVIGEELGRFYGYKYVGLIESQEQLDAWNAYAAEHGKAEYQLGARVGDCLYEDTDGDGAVTEDDREILGSGMPKLNFGISAKAEWKGIDLTVSTFGALGFHVSDHIYNTLTSCYGVGNKDPKVMSEGSPNVYYSASEAGHSPLAWNDLFSERKIQNANYWKIANIELGYNFNDDWFHGVVSNVRAYVSGQNVLTFSRYKGYNIDYAQGTFTPGFNYCSFPTPRTIMFGLQCSF